MEVVDCLFGHQALSDVAFVGHDRLGVADEGFSIRRCRVCGLLFLSPRPSIEEIGMFYPYTEYKAEFVPAIADEASLVKRWNRYYSLNKLCRFVERARHSGRLLDVGCATGNFLNLMRARGKWEVSGLDTADEASAYARQRFGLDVFSGTLIQAGYASHAYDVVTMWNVIEHLHDPVEMLKEVRRILRPDGFLAFSMPNADSLDAKLFGRFWIGLDPPRHLYIFSHSTLTALMRATGFEIVKIQYISGSYHSCVASKQLFLSRRQSVFPRPVTLMLMRLVTSLPVHILLLPYLRLAEVVGRGAIFSVLARPVEKEEL